MFITYRELYPEDYSRPSLSLDEQLKREQADYERREAARLARNAARDERQARWPERRENGVLVVPWAVLADGLAKSRTTEKEN